MVSTNVRIEEEIWKKLKEIAYKEKRNINIVIINHLKTSLINNKIKKQQDDKKNQNL